jgi:hypothetical protein
MLSSSMALIWETGLGRVLQTLKKKNQKPLFEALLKVKEGAPHFFSFLFFAPMLIAGGLHAQMV